MSTYRRLLGAPLLGATLLVSSLAVGAQAVPPPKPSQPQASFLVGAAKKDIRPDGVVNKGGFGLGDGSVLPDEVVGRGSEGRSESEPLWARAFVVDNGEDVLAFVISENIGMFAKYQNGPGLIDIGESIERETGGAIDAEHVVAAGNHSHSGPDTLGAWGGVSREYLQRIHDQSVAAVLEAYNARQPAELLVGTSDGRQKFVGSQGSYDLIDNQVCTETASNSFEGSNNVCVARQESVDSLVRVIQARAITPASTGAINSAKGCTGPGDHEGRTCSAVGDPVATLVTYAAHPTLGGANGVHGDWPEYVATAAENLWGGTAIAWPGAIGRVQPERNWHNRKADFAGYMLTMMGQALDTATPIMDNSIGASKTLIKSEVTNPVLAGLLLEGERLGAPLMRSKEAPWMVGGVIQTVVSAARIGDVAFMGVPGEAYPQIALGAAATTEGERTVFTLGLADDMLGYLIAHTEDYPVIAGITPVNDNALFNASPRIGDHVMCAGIRMLGDVGFSSGLEPRCIPFNAEDLITANDF